MTVYGENELTSASLVRASQDSTQSQGGAVPPIVHNGDHAEFEAEWAGKDPRTRPDWPLPSFDARDWAETFCKLNPGMDEGLMIGWFANAIMCGYDAATNRNIAKTPPENTAKSDAVADVNSKSPSDHQGLVEEIKPYAYEFGRSNGDDTYSVVIERGSVLDGRRASPDWPVKALYEQTALTSLLARVKELEERAKAAEKALVSLTPDGSEFYTRDGDGFRVDVKACMEFISRRREDQHKTICNAISERKAAEASHQQIRTALEEIESRAKQAEVYGRQINRTEVFGIIVDLCRAALSLKPEESR